jgi:hypothetical protein
MATENITVEQRKVRTASFDVTSRVLTLPILDNAISPELYDLFMGHEVGHALFTPEELLSQAHEQKLTHSVLNAIEDVRIERKIKSKYPGLKQPFIKGYKELIEKNFFGTNDTNLNDLNFIDRTNLYFKLGVNSKITFTNPIEIKLIDEIAVSETVDDVLLITKKVMEYLKAERHEKQEYADSEEGRGDFDDDFEYEEDEYEEDESGEEDEGGDKDGEDGNDEVESLTDQTFQKNQSKLFADDKREYFYGNIPDINLNDIIVPHDIIWDEYSEWTKTFWPHSYDYNTDIQKTEFQNFRTDSKKVVNYLVKEFELKKNAEQLKRSSIAKTGEIDMNSIFSYKFNEDIFRKITVIPGGKSHGLVMFLDWSGSMRNNLHNTVKQLLNLVLFCKQINIPFEVYAFTSMYSRYSKSYQQPFKEQDLKAFDFVSMLNLLSNKMTTKQFNYAATSLLSISTNKFETPRSFRLGSTPLNAAIMVAMKLLPKFKSDYKLQNVNVVFLTDGSSDTTNQIYYKDGLNDRLGTGDREYDCSYKSISKSLIVRDPKSKHQEEIKDIYDLREVTAAYLKLLKSITNCNIVGFYIINKRELQQELTNLFKDTINFDKIKSEFRVNNYKIVDNAGYDEYYLLRSESLDTNNDTDFTFKKTATPRGIASSFAKFAAKRTTNRVILNRFISMIA